MLTFVVVQMPYPMGKGYLWWYVSRFFQKGSSVKRSGWLTIRVGLLRALSETFLGLAEEIGRSRGLAQQIHWQVYRSLGRGFARAADKEMRASQPFQVIPGGRSRKVVPSLEVIVCIACMVNAMIAQYLPVITTCNDGQVGLLFWVVMEDLPILYHALTA